MKLALLHLLTYQAQRLYVVIIVDDGVRTYPRLSGVQAQNKLMTDYAAGSGGSL